jgi:hypothetical protein
MAELLDELMTRELVGGEVQKAQTEDEKDVIVDPHIIGQFNPYLPDAEVGNLAAAWQAKDQLDAALKPGCIGPSGEHDVFTAEQTGLLTCANCERTWEPAEDPRKPWLEEIREQLDQPWEHYTDYGSGSWDKLIGDRPELDTQEFGEYVTEHNRADRDSGELGDIARFELDRLAEEYLQERQLAKADTERAHRISQMSEVPVVPRVEVTAPSEPVEEEQASGGGVANLAVPVTKADVLSVRNLVDTGHRVTIEKVLPQLAPVIQYPKKLRKTAERDPVTGRITHVTEEVVED